MDIGMFSLGTHQRLLFGFAKTGVGITNHVGGRVSLLIPYRLIDEMLFKAGE